MIFYVNFVFKLTAKPPHSGHLLQRAPKTDIFLGNGWNEAQTLISKPLCSGHFIANTSLQWTSFLGPKPH